jgi:sporulation protein YlmC with PRC-barrel domain
MLKDASRDKAKVKFCTYVRKPERRSLYSALRSELLRKRIQKNGEHTMHVKSIAMIALLVTTSTAALAANAANTSPPNTNVQQQMTTNLQQSGFTDIKVQPDSFLVQAKDRSGDPVTMFITPNSMAEFVADDSRADTTPGTNGGVFRNVPAKSELASKVIGLDVYNNDDKSIGQIKDVALNSNGRVDGYILSVGGFLGIGDHYVAVRPSSVNFTRDKSSEKWRATMNVTANQLKAAPEFKYQS